MGQTGLLQKAAKILPQWNGSRDHKGLFYLLSTEGDDADTAEGSRDHFDRCKEVLRQKQHVVSSEKKPTCFSQVQIRTTHRLLDCSKGIDQCSVRLWAALLSSAGSRGIWLIQERLQLTLGYFRSCERPLYSWRAWDNHFNRWHTRRRLWSCERSSRCLPWKKFWVKCPFHWLHYPCHFKCAHQSVVSHSKKLSHFPKHSTFKSHPFVFFLSLGSNGLSSHDPFPELFVTILVLVRRPAPQMV